MKAMRILGILTGLLIVTGVASAQAPAAAGGEVQIRPFAIGELVRRIAGENELIRRNDTELLKRNYGFDVSDDKMVTDFAKHHTLVRGLVGGEQEYSLNAVNYWHASAPPAAGPANILIQVRSRKKVTDLNGREDALLSFERDSVFAMVLDNGGRTKEINWSAFDMHINPKKHKLVEVEVTYTVGLGLYDKKVCDGLHPAAAVGVPGKYDFFALDADGIKEKIQWTGPTKKFTSKITLDSTGAWTWQDNGFNINATGQVK